jgi:quercetin dioxygenase-like cupin family protein
VQKAVLLEPGEGEPLRVGADHVLVRLRGEATGDAFSLVEYQLAPGEGPGQHVHEHCAETYYVLEGEVVFRLGPERHVLTPHALLHVPPGVVHGFRNESDALVRLLWLFSPGHHLDGMGWGD